MNEVNGPAIGYRVGGRYELTAPIATGGMAQVWRAHDAVLDRPVAVKILHSHLATDHGFLTRFRREAVAAARLSHPSIVAIYDTVSTPAASPGGPSIEAIVMELIEGPTLRTVLDENPRLSTADSVRVGLQVAEALDEAHKGGVVHRDIKPSNILLCDDRRVMVTDFGIAKAGEDTDLTVTGTLLGTAKYLAPEQVRGEEVDPRADLYSLGVVLFEAVAGRPPFLADTDAATALARLHNDPPDLLDLRPDADSRLAAVVMRLLQRDPADRLSRAVDVRAALSVIDRADVTEAVNKPTANQRLDPTTVDRTAHLAPTNPPRIDMPASGHPSDKRAGQTSPGPTSDRDETDGDDSGFVRSERSWLIPAVVVMVMAAALVLAATLFNRSPLGSSSIGSSAEESAAENGDSEQSTDTTPLSNFDELVEASIVGATSFDPGGDGSENEDLVDAAFDDDPETSWRTETYRDANFGRLKSGVGLLLDLGGRAEVSEIEFLTDTIAWKMEIYVGNDFSDEPASWGEPVERISYDGDDDYNVDLDGVIGTMVLLWITDHGISEERDDNPLPDFRFELAEVTVS